MKTSNKKGFTIVELVIVIAVIAILAAVLIPTFNSVITKANKSAAQQKASHAYTIAASEFSEKLSSATVVVTVKKNASANYYFEFKSGSEPTEVAANNQTNDVLSNLSTEAKADIDADVTAIKSSVAVVDAT